jgi:hypothetical protein
LSPGTALSTLRTSLPNEPAATRLRACTPLNSLGSRPPQFHRVRQVELVGDRRPEVRADHRLERVALGCAPGELLRDHVAQRADREALVEPQEQVDGLQREVDPFAEQPNAAVARAILEVGTEQRADVGEDRGVGRRMQAVAAVVEPLAAEFERARVAAVVRAGLEQRRGPELAARELARGSDAGRAAAEDHDARASHGSGSR